MSTWPSWETARLAWEGIRFWLIIGTGSLIGLLGAYGREQHEGRKPDRRWLGLRLCVMPFLALAAAAAAETLHLSGQVAAFLASVFSMLAYDLVRVIALRALKKVAAGEVTLPTDAAVEVPGGKGVPEIVKITTAPATPMRGELRKAFPVKPAHDATLDGLIDRLSDDI